MKNRLTMIGLSDDFVSEILEVFDNYLLTKAEYTKPASSALLQDNLSEIERLSKKLHKQLRALTTLERGLLLESGMPGIREFAMATKRLSLSCNTAKAKKTKQALSKKHHAELNLAYELKQLLERHRGAVTKYRDNILCKILNILLEEQPDSERSFNLVRNICKKPS